ncbi:hypothetical protein [Lysinibacillus sp. Y5S-8]|uniref:hypothetical protein n=1 Tax=unclassified Lysinibacillus TaxID=2636778 RepID=UPI0030CDFDEE
MQNSNIDRATRLGITLTILGVIWYVLIKSFDFTFFVFNNLNTKSLFSSEHIIALVLVTMLVTIFIGGSRYIFSELKTFKDFNDDIIFEEAKNEANKNFNEIFSILYLNIALFVITTMFILFIELMMNFFNLFWWISTLIFLVLISSLVLIIKKMRNKFFEVCRKIYDAVKLRKTHMSFWFYILFLLFILFFTYSVLSFSKGQTVDVDFENNSMLPIDIQLTNIQLENLKIHLYMQEKEDWFLIKEIDIDKKDFSGSFFEVYESSSLLENKSNGISRINSNKQQSTLKNNINLGEEIEEILEEGKYKIQITIHSKDGNKIVKLSNDFEIKGDKYIFNKDKFKIEL